MTGSLRPTNIKNRAFGAFYVGGGDMIYEKRCW